MGFSFNPSGTVRQACTTEAQGVAFFSARGEVAQSPPSSSLERRTRPPFHMEVSGNGTSVAGVRPGWGEAYFLEFGARAADELSIPVILVGGMRSGATIESVLANTNIEFVSLSRPLLREPSWPLELQKDARATSKCISCNRCYHTPAHRCVFRIGR